MKSFIWILCVLLGSVSLSCSRGDETASGESAGEALVGPLSPEDALGSFQLEPGYRVELVAAEPLISDPVAIAFDERGRLYVVESRGYPDPVDEKTEITQEGVIALLEDTDKDGRYDKRSEFAGGLTYPNGIMVWDGGIFVTCAPDLFYFKDTDGDGKADLKKVVLTGFSQTKTAQIRFNHPTLGLDGWIYFTSGLNGGQIKVTERPNQAAVEFERSDSRFHPRTQVFELTGGQGQFGLTFDDFGRRFTCSNRHPVWQVMLESRHLKRNPHLAFSETVQEVSKVGGEAVVWPISPDRTTASFISNLIGTPHAGTYTAASGVHIHRGDALPEGHEGSIFVCESAQNLVQRQVMTPDRATFTSKPARDGVEFMASRDSWFSPVFAANGPDGALYLVDMYRKIIDHPAYVPEESRQLLDFDAGKGYGRIYRLVAENKTPERKAFDLSSAGAQELAGYFSHPNAWWRHTAHRLLLERQDQAAIPILTKLAAHGGGEVERLHALWTLENLGALETAQVLQALQDSHPGVRENAIRLSESRLKQSGEISAHLLKMGDDPDARVRFQLALALGDLQDPAAVDLLARIARRDGDHLWTRMAVLTSIGGRSGAFLKAFVAERPSSAEIQAAVMEDLGRVFGAGEPPEQCVALLLEITKPGNDLQWQPAAVAGLAEGLQRRGLAKGDQSALRALVAGSSADRSQARQRLEALMERAMQLARDEQTKAETRLAAIRLLGYADHARVGSTLQELLAPRSTAEIQMAAVRALGALSTTEAARVLVEPARWQAYTPQVRESAISVLMSQPKQLPVLLEAIEAKHIQPTALNPSRRKQLMNHSDKAIQERANQLFADLVSGNRMQIYEKYRDQIATLTGDPQKGQTVFTRQCGTCHVFAGSGSRLGPDLSGIGNQRPEAILLHILVPDYEGTPGYDSYVVETTDGKNLFGLLASEAANSVTIRDAAGQDHVIPRTQIARMSASPTSLMPAELERLMSEQDLSDLIAYLTEGAIH